ncbi:hypothetical protein PUR59_10850 [Streptomyces sp. SP18ES09]|uniref:hypothetical protein n=1 Tax=Streptomyces sp. SP18ES09 TaxID=3002532 RepID=UPI002E7A3E3F|nr:hypothetical protein [Streptomyces sp. SP18ES09]MEE1815512.1 hypothetical protein [Streptomyces sp. SP18ES09]
MTPGRCSRAVRAAMFAAVCVLLAALGHILMSGHAVPGRTLGAGLAGTLAVAWALGGRERGLLAVTSATVAVQSALHLAFSWSQSAAGALPAGRAGAGHGGMATAPMTMPHMGMDPMTMPHMAMGSMDMGHMDHAASDAMLMGHLAAAPSATGSAGHDMTDMTSSAGMLAAHLLAALLSGLWLAYGERAAFRLLRSAPAGLLRTLGLPGLLGLLLAVAPPAADRPRVRRARPGAGRVPRRLLLARTLLTRGPPRATAVL